LIEEYLRLFEFITHHGTYIDGFAAPQERDKPEMWAAKRVLEMTPKWFRDFWLCDIDPDGVRLLEELQREHSSPHRTIHVLEGDFNKKVEEILGSGLITETVATFALLDQRTFECEWSTVQALSRHKSNKKIELFYFFPTGWIDRSLAAVRDPKTIAKVDRWWGRTDWRSLIRMNGTVRAKMVASRFEQELGYGRASPYAIHSERRGGRVMYHMIHATDHPEAPLLMVRAYRKVSGRSELHPSELQQDFEELWRDLQTEEE
jgi:three-Cys-motif partner protein